jgi:threonine aldolase
VTVKDFASDNHAGVHPDLLEAVAAANTGHCGSYGADEWTEGAEAAFREQFGPEARAFPVFNGTGANVASMDALTRPFEAAICTDVAHMHVDECGAPERLAGTKLLLVPHTEGKLTPDDLARWEAKRGDEHHVQPRVVSITQSTELGTVYTLEETRAIAETAHRLGMLLHIDGARLANAAASLGVTLRELTTDAGVDIVSFGATKNGALVGDAVVVLDPGLAQSFPFTRKQLGQLASKMRFISAQLQALLADGLWLRNATHANDMANRLAAAVSENPAVEIVYPVESNAVFVRLERPAIDDLLARLEGEHPFYIWDDAENIVRWMCAWDTAPEDVEQFAAAVAEVTRAAA